MVKYKGVYITTKKDRSISYRVSLTHRGRHISLGSYSNGELAHKVYNEGRHIIEESSITKNDYSVVWDIPHSKFICLVNFRDNGIYFPTPIYLHKKYFEYYITENTILKFDRDDLFFYSSHKIMNRGGYLFVNDYGSQYSILSRYGIKPFSVYGRDYIMQNGDRNDYRYENILIINHYIGVRSIQGSVKSEYMAYIHINGDYIIGRYGTEAEAAIAYNKAADTVRANGISRAYIKNYIVSLDKEAYRSIYDSIIISDKLININRTD